MASVRILPPESAGKGTYCVTSSDRTRSGVTFAARVVGRETYRFVGPVAAALIVRSLVAFVVLRSMPLVSDAASYAEVAERLLEHFPGDFAYFWPPGMPYAIWAVWSVIGTGTTEARLLTVAIGVVNVVLVMLLARAVGGNDRIVTVAGWLAALFPPAVLLGTQTYSEGLTTTCLLAAVTLGLAGWRTGRSWLVACAGLPLGYAVVTRPAVVSVVVAFLLLAVVVRTRAVLLGSAGALALVLAVAAPVAAHNRAHDAGLTISTNNERNVWLGNNRYTPLYKTSHLAQRERDELPADVRAYIERIESRSDARQAMREETVRYVAAHPLESILRTVNRVRAFWGYDYVLSREIQKAYEWGDARLLLPLAFEAGGYLVVAVAIVVGLVAGRRHLSRAGLAVIAVLALAYQLPYAFVFTVSSYHAPALALLMPVAAAGAVELWTQHGGVFRQRGLILALCVFAAVQIEYTWFAVRYR